ncbi:MULTISPECIES: acyltransferase [unclassified Mesorhizobium]|uniref:acyltransferase family protein n=1 Tax=Mesorhizobium TaxID=68287 RepID=UPI00040B0476|nr:MULTISPECIES: acyltransferase [unclassified Mesorhizobium]
MDSESYRSNALDGLRGIAATSVIFYHAILHHQVLIDTILIPPIQSLSTFGDVATKIVLAAVNGNSAVLLFFVLSGFVLRLSLERDKARPIVVVVNFVVRRLCRLYPAMFFCMGCFLAVAILYQQLGWAGFPVPNLGAALVNASLFKITWHGPSGTIQAEFLAVPFILAAFFIGRTFGPIAVLACVAYSIFAFGNPAMVLWAPNMHSWLSAFMVGMLVADKRLKPFFSEMTGPALVLLCVGFFVLRAATDMNGIQSAVGQTALCGALVGAVYYASPKLAVVRFLNWHPVLFLGRISYSLYLLNVIWLFVAWSIVVPLGVETTHPLFTGMVVGTVVLLLTIPLAAFSERLFEQGGVWLGQRLTIRQPAKNLAFLPA